MYRFDSTIDTTANVCSIIRDQVAMASNNLRPRLSTNVDDFGTNCCNGFAPAEAGAGGSESKQPETKQIKPAFSRQDRTKFRFATTNSMTVNVTL